MEQKVMRQLKRALKPAFTDVKVSFGEQKSVVLQSPYRLPPLFSGSRLLVYASLPRDFVASKVKFTAESAKGPVTQEVDIDPAKAVKGKLIHRLAGMISLFPIHYNL